MSMEKINRQALFSWLAIGSLAVLCSILAVLQYRWLGEISRGERDRLQAGLQSALDRLRHEFNSEITAACAALMPTGSQVDEMGREAAYIDRYIRWKDSGRHDRLFRRIALATPAEDVLTLRHLDDQTRRFGPAEWPADWKAMRERLMSRLRREPPGPFGPAESTLIDLPRFGRPGGRGDSGRPGLAERDWLIAELDLEYVRGEFLPELLQRHLGDGGSLDYHSEVVAAGDPSILIYRPASDQKAAIAGSADASVTLLEVRYDQIARRSRPPGPQRPDRPPETVTGDSGRGRWRLSVRHHAGSLETIVARARFRNLAISAGLLLLILAAVAALVRLSRQAHKLVETQMNFVASVSHELRTPLAVIRTAAYNLRSKIGYPGQVERYGTLIQQESEKLTAIVEQVLTFASLKAGRAVREREPVSVGNLIENALRSSKGVVEGARCMVEKQVEPGLPLILGDSMALQQALQNLIQNAVKYGTEGSNWIGISASSRADRGGSAIEIRVADRGPGIPPEEQKQIFDPFFRGIRAVQDQIHGTGLGLNLVKRIVEEHGGTIEVHSEPMRRTEFVMRIPAAPAEHQDEFAHSVSRG